MGESYFARADKKDCDAFLLSLGVRKDRGERKDEAASTSTRSASYTHMGEHQVQNVIEPHISNWKRA